ncbi:hypothetical protein A0H81_07420 [Grifola frondosa]|uniref:Uncharacterized protein n=1 Tax=Grifola frondosa TaxID=5627 RepID=A0A1C7M5H6_GRIFR|nr:hypothetical protein A0H81_07420 [Grifola frondosa]
MRVCTSKAYSARNLYAPPPHQPYVNKCFSPSEVQMVFLLKHPTTFGISAFCKSDVLRSGVVCDVAGAYMRT